MSELAKIVQELAGTRNQDEVRIYQATVNSVDMDKRLCEVTTVTGNATLTFNAQLTAGVADGMIYEPEIDSFVYVAFSKYAIPFVILYSDLASLILKGGEFGGLVKVIELTEKLNNLENKVNEIIAIFDAHVHSALNAPTTTLITETLTPTQREDIENATIKHGES